MKHTNILNLEIQWGPDILIWFFLMQVHSPAVSSFRIMILLMHHIYNQFWDFKSLWFQTFLKVPFSQILSNVINILQTDLFMKKFIYPQFLGKFHQFCNSSDKLNIDLRFFFGSAINQNTKKALITLYILNQGQLQIWTEHSTLISLDLKILEISKKSFTIILTT